MSSGFAEPRGRDSAAALFPCYRILVPGKRKDLVLFHSPTEDGKGVSVLRAREDTIEAGVLRPLEEGKPVVGEVVKLTQRAECPILFDAETQVRVTAPEVTATDTAARRSGPAQVATDTYRKGWDAVWRRPDPTLN